MDHGAAQHAGCSERSVAGRLLEQEFGEWLQAAVALDAERRARVTAIVRAKVRRGSDAAKASPIRTAIKRLTDAFTWGAIEEDDYRGQLAELRAQLAVSEHLPDEHRILEATAIAQDIPRAWGLATPEQRRWIVWSTMSEATFAPIVGNTKVASAAVEFVLAQEERRGRQAHDSRKPSGHGDVQSDGRIIEVIACGNRIPPIGLLVTPGQVDKLEKNSHYAIYVVENIRQGNPAKFELRELRGVLLREVLANKKVQRYRLPVPVAAYAKMPRLDQ